MKKIKTDFKKGEAKINVDNLDDLWYLSQLIDVNDFITGKTYRKIKLSSSDEKSKVEKIPITLKIKVGKVDFDNDSLRVNGTVESEVEDIPKGSYHSINIELGSIITLEKKKWFKFQIEKLEDSCKEGKKILIVSLDREKVVIAINKNEGYEVLLKLDGDVQKKEEQASFKGDFYSEIIAKVEEYVKRYKIESVIVGSPAFWKEEFMKKIKNDSLRKKISLTTCYSHGENSINEILKSNDVKEIMEKDRTVKEMELVNELLEKISKEAEATYGLKEVTHAVNIGAAKALLITDTLINDYRSENKFEVLEELMKLVDDMKGEIHIINEKNDAGKKLNGLSGIGAILRYKLQ